MKIPFSVEILGDALRELGIADAAKATIRQTGDIARFMEGESETEFLHLEMGVPVLSGGGVDEYLRCLLSHLCLL